MPTNVSYEYEEAEKKYFQARTNSEKLAALKEMLSKAPSHKGAENLRADIKQRIAKLKAIIDKERQQKKKSFHISVKKEGAATVCILGVVNSGKSSLLNLLSGCGKARVSEYPYTTAMPEVGVMDYKSVKIQIIEIPAIIKDYTGSKNGPSFLSIVRNSDLVVLLLRENYEEEFNLVLDELEKGGIVLNKDVNKEGFISLRAIIVLNNERDFSFKGFSVFKLDKDIKENIWNSLGLIYVYTKSPGKEKDEPAIALKEGSTIRDLAAYIHKDFLRKFKFARLWGKSSKFKGYQIVGLNHVLKSGDIVEIHAK